MANNSSGNVVHYHYHYYYCKHHRHWIRRGDEETDESSSNQVEQDANNFSRPFPPQSTRPANGLLNSLRQSFRRSNRRRLLHRRRSQATTSPLSNQLCSNSHSDSSIETTDYIMQGPIAINKRLKSATGIKDTFDHRGRRYESSSWETSLPDYKENESPFSEPLASTKYACENLYGALKSKKAQSLTEKATLKPKVDALMR